MMAEQEFLSWYWAGSWNTIHKKNNFQIHQMYLTTPRPPSGQSTTASFHHMVEHPEEIKVFHFSADDKSSNILVDVMPSVQGWLDLDVASEEPQEQDDGMARSKNS